MTALFIINEFRRKRALKKLGESDLIKRLIPEMSRIRPVVKFILLLTGNSQL